MATARVDVPVLAIPGSFDRLIKPMLTQEVVGNLSHVTVATLPTDRRHLGYLQEPGTAEYAFIGENRGRFWIR